MENSNSNSIKPCPVCNVKMAIRQISALGENGQRQWFYFMYCRQCGYGPLHAYETGEEAISSWNHYSHIAKKRHHPLWF